MFILQDIDSYETTGSDKVLQFDREIYQHKHLVVPQLQRKHMAHACNLFCSWKEDGNILQVQLEKFVRASHVFMTSTALSIFLVESKWKK